MCLKSTKEGKDDETNDFLLGQVMSVNDVYVLFDQRSLNVGLQRHRPSLSAITIPAHQGQRVLKTTKSYLARNTFDFGHASTF